MQKRFFYAIQEVEGCRYLWRFRSRAERQEWFASRQPTNNQPEFVSGNNSAVRRAYRQIAAGENIQFPLDIT